MKQTIKLRPMSERPERNCGIYIATVVETLKPDGSTYYCIENLKLHIKDGDWVLRYGLPSIMGQRWTDFDSKLKWFYIDDLVFETAQDLTKE